MNRLRHATAVVAIVLTGVCAWSMAAAQGIYTCVDAKGRKLTSDRFIADCADRPQSVLNPSGTLKATLPPAMSDAERARQEARLREEREAQARLAEERRTERALLTRYPNQAAHDHERAQAIAQANDVKEVARVRSESLKRDGKRIDEQMEFYKKDPRKAPQSLQSQVEEVRKGLLAQEKILATQDAEIDRINHRFDAELTRLQGLWAQQSGR